MSTHIAAALGTLPLYVRREHFPWLVVTVLDVMYETSWQFNSDDFAALRPRDGHVTLAGRDRYEARAEVRARLERLGVLVSESPVS